jgi:adenine-specific DNA-methyltransferase
MNKEQAKSLLDDTFNKEFNQDKFISFLNELLNGFRASPRTIGVDREYEEYISSAKILGKYEFGKNNMEVYAVKLKKTSSLERARTMQRNYIAKWLSKFNIDGALVAFYGDDSPDWRFSFVKMDYKLVEDEKGKVKTEKELTPAKRYSFLVGINEPNHTCKTQFIDLLKEESKNPSLEELENAFGIEKVTKEFFFEYKELFHKLAESLENIMKKDFRVSEEFKNKNISVIDFSKKLLGQIVFIYFLQKKGWLGVSRKVDGSFDEWGTGPKNFLRKLFDKKICNYENFFNDILEPLFYEALAKERDDDYYSRFKCKIPFLNGGLFEPINNYDWTKTEIILDNSIFKDILDTFDKYNFTIKEDEPLEKEVAVDPEMLGKVFENLLEVNDRKSKGAFYTPREIVHYMCQQSLVNYLQTNSDLPREDLEFFIQKGDFAMNNFIRYQEDMKYNKVSKIKKEDILPETIVKNYKKLDELLKNVKIVDPAVGSGAFPVGMMNEVVKSRALLTHFFNDFRSDYDLKRETIENCLYGVDIESSAVEITKLRFWLSLIVDELDMKNIKPLPNLDNKIMCGNSLIEEFKGIKLYQEPTGNVTIKQAALDEFVFEKKKDSEVKLKRLRELQQDLFNEQNRRRKEEIRNEIENIEWDFIEATLKEQNSEEAMKELEQYKKNKSKPFFLWKLYFSDVFNRENPGFDIVIGNPPYIDYRKIDQVTKDGLRDFNSYKITKTGSIYVYFIEFGLSILKKNGTLVYINPYQYLSADSGYGIRKFAIDNSKISKIIDVSNIRVFAEASTYTCINFFINSFVDNNKIEIVRCDKLEEIDKKGFFIDQEETKKDSYRINISEENRVIDKVSLVETTLDKFCKIFCGTSAGGFGKKIIKNKEYESLSEKEKKEYIKVVQSSNVGRYFFKDLTKYIPLKIYPKNVIDYFSKEKIFFARMTKEIRCMYSLDTLAGGKINLLVDLELNYSYLVALLNSSLLTYWYYNKFESKHLSGGYLGFDIPTVKEIPIKKISPEEQKPFIEIVNRILEITKEKDYLEDSVKQKKVKILEEEIDKMVYKIYDLTPEEIKIVEEFGK